MRRARVAFEQAHLRLFVVDASSDQQDALALLQSLLDANKPEEEEEEEQGGGSGEGRVVVVANKVDLLRNGGGQQRVQELSSWLGGRGGSVPPQEVSHKGVVIVVSKLL